VHVVELQRRYGGIGIKAYSLYPGAISSTKIGRDERLIQEILSIPTASFLRTIDQGAMTNLYWALSNKAEPGKYHSNCQIA